jgi:undecaprenyl-diphosphatase
MYGARRRDLRRAALRGLLGALGGRLIAFVSRGDGERLDEATTAGFITGAGLEIPLAAAPLGVLGAWLHRDTTDLGPASPPAVAAGVVAAAASVKVWPIPPRLGPTAPRVHLPAHAEPNNDGEGLTIVVNAASGVSDDGGTGELTEALPKATIVEVTPERGDELRKALDKAVSEGAVALGVSGGDGSINTAAQVALEAEKALMVLPTGTFNHLARDVGLDSTDDAIEAVKSGEAVGVDVATIGGHVFLNTASFGSYVELVDARERLEKRIGKWPAVVVALVRVLRHSQPIDVEIDGAHKKVWMAFIGNCRYHPSGFAPTWRERLDDGLLDLRYVSGDQPYARTRLIMAVMTGRLGRSKVYSQSCVKSLRLRSLNGPLRLARDGESFDGPNDIVIEKLDKRLALYAPHSKSG